MYEFHLIVSLFSIVFIQQIQKHAQANSRLSFLAASRAVCIMVYDNAGLLIKHLIFSLKMKITFLFITFSEWFLFYVFKYFYFTFSYLL